MYQTANPAAEALSSATEAQRSAKTSTWTGLVDLDKAGVPSIADNSSEISEEHVVLHLNPGEGWDERHDGPNMSQPSQDESDTTNSSNALGLSDLEGLESHGGSAHEEEDGTYFALDSPTLSSVASSTPQTQTSNSILADFINTLLMPIKYWTGDEEGNKTEEGPTAPEEKAADNQTHGEASGRNLSIPKSSGNKGSMDNAITEDRSGTFSFRASSSEPQSPEEGLSEQEKEVVPLIRLVPAVQNTGRTDTSTHSGEQAADNPQSTAKGKTFIAVQRRV